MIRRIRIASNNPLIDLCRDAGFKVEYVRGFDGKDDYSTCVVEFPFAYPEETVLAKDVSAIDQLNFVRELQTSWSDNSVSCTVYFRPEELDEIREYLARNYNTSHKSLSFLLHSDHGFDQAPFEEIDKETYDALVSSTVPLDIMLRSGRDKSLLSSIGLGQEECESGACPVR